MLAAARVLLCLVAAYPTSLLRMEAAMHSILVVAVGAIVGVLARFIGPGKRPSPFLGSVFFGVAGAIGGQFLGRLFGFARASDSADFVTGLVGAVLLVVLYHAAVLRRTAH
jgi:uncharacterized membrane protein YeaQ/YmgE (transglycosylase-associated protein family)